MKKWFILIGLFLSLLFISNNALADGDKYGAIVHLYNDPSHNDWTSTSLDLLVQSGAKWVRFDIPSIASPYDFSWYKPYLKLAKDKGLKILGIIWHPSEFNSLSDFQTYYPLYVKNITTQFNGYVDAYEIWNEPTIHFSGWYSSSYPDKHDLPVKYEQMLQAAYNTIKSINSTVTVVGIGGGLIQYGSDDYTFFKNVTVDLGGAKYMDAFSLHVYDFPSATTSEPAFSNVSISDMKARINKSKSLTPTLPVWITETGTSSFAFTPSWCYQNNCDQSFLMSRDLRMLNDVGVSKIFWYELRDDSGLTPNEENYYGLLDNNFNPKPSYTNFQTLVNVYCTDTDSDSYSSPNIFSKGTISGAVKTTTGYASYSYTDSCSGANVVEYDCDGQNNKSSTRSCGSSYICYNGACIYSSGGSGGGGCRFGPCLIAIGPYVLNIDITSTLSTISAILVLIEIVILMTIYNRLKRHKKRKR